MARKEDGGSQGGSATSNAGAGRVRLEFSARIRGWTKKLMAFSARLNNFFPNLQIDNLPHDWPSPLSGESILQGSPTLLPGANHHLSLALCPLLHSDLHLVEPVGSNTMTPTMRLFSPTPSGPRDARMD